MEPEGSLPHSQQPANCLYPEPERSSPCPPSHLSKIHFNIILSTPGSSKWYPSLKLPHKNPVYKSLPHTCHMPCPSQFSWFHYPNNENNWTHYLCISELWLGLRLDDREIEADSRREEKKVLPFRYSNKNCVCIPYLYHVCNTLLQTRSDDQATSTLPALHTYTQNPWHVPPPPPGRYKTTWASDASLFRFLNHTHWQTHTQQVSPERVIGPYQGPLPTEHSQQTNTHAPSGIRTHNPSKRAAIAINFWCVRFFKSVRAGHVRLRT